MLQPHPTIRAGHPGVASRSALHAHLFDGGEHVLDLLGRHWVPLLVSRHLDVVGGDGGGRHIPVNLEIARPTCGTLACTWLAQVHGRRSWRRPGSPVGCALTFASEAKFEIEAKILSRLEAKKKA